MAPFFANPRIFSAFAIASDEDPMTSDVALGTHIRLLPSPLIGFPISPFGLWRVAVQSDDDRVTAWIDREQKTASPDLDAAGGELTALVGAPPGPEELRDVAVEIEPAGPAKMSVGLRRVDQRRIAQRSAAPWLLGAPSLRRIDLWGTAPALHLKVFSVSAGGAVELMMGRSAGLYAQSSARRAIGLVCRRRGTRPSPRACRAGRTATVDTPRSARWLIRSDPHLG